ncbi:MAG: peptide chain release factor N(5)-glutamine methyltransferase [Patescibacteria group bacterium]
MNLKKLYSQSVLKLKEVSASPELDVQVLLSYATSKDKTFLLSHPEFEPSKSQINKFQKLLKKRQNNVPIVYLTGKKEFFGYEFLVTPDVLIPRPESEFLVEQAVEVLQKKLKIVNCKLKILDLGTGSGCLIISLAKKLDELYELSNFINLYASDISAKALKMARKNAKKLLFEARGRELSNQAGSRLCSNNTIKFIHSDLFQNHQLHKKPASPSGGFDLIIANLPYVPKLVSKCEYKVLSNELETHNTKYIIHNTVKFEPQNAIFADDNGSEIIKRFLAQARNHLAEDGTILIELDPRNAMEIEKFSHYHYPTAKIELKKDLAGLDRYLTISLSSY